MTDRIGPGREARLACLIILIAMSVGRAEAGRISGKIVDREGIPVGGARVWASKLSTGEPLEVREAADNIEGVAIEAGTGRWFVFALQGEESGRCGFDDLPKIADGKDPTPIWVRLGPPTRPKGRLLDAEGGADRRRRTRPG